MLIYSGHIVTLGNHILPAIWASFNPVKWMHTISRHSFSTRPADILLRFVMVQHMSEREKYLRLIPGVVPVQYHIKMRTYTLVL